MRFNYEQRGSGSPLVLLHGIGHHWQAWTPVLDRLAERHTVYAVDLPGFGGSPLPPGCLPDGMRSAVAMIGEAFREWNLDRPHVAGNSLGGAIALELAASGLASSATALAPAGFYTPGEVRLALANLRTLRLCSRLPVAFLRPFLRTRAGRTVGFGMLLGHPTRIPAEQALADTLALRRATGFDAIARHARQYRFAGPVSVPVTVVWGDRDRILLPRQARRARERLPHARHVPLARAGHVPMFDEPQLVAEVILQTTALAEDTAPSHPVGEPPSIPTRQSGEPGSVHSRHSGEQLRRSGREGSVLSQSARRQPPIPAREARQQPPIPAQRAAEQSSVKPAP